MKTFLISTHLSTSCYFLYLLIFLSSFVFGGDSCSSILKCDHILLTALFHPYTPVQSCCFTLSPSLFSSSDNALFLLPFSHWCLPACVSCPPSVSLLAIFSLFHWAAPGGATCIQGNTLGSPSSKGKSRLCVIYVNHGLLTQVESEDLYLLLFRNEWFQSQHKAHVAWPLTLPCWSVQLPQQHRS